MKNKVISLLGLVLAGLLLCGCATKGRPFQLVQPIPPGKGVLYVYVNNRGLPNAEVLINDSVVGCLRRNDYMAFLCQSGPLTVSTGYATIINSLPVNITSGSQNFVNVTCRYNAITPQLVSEREALGQIQKRMIVQPSHGLADELSGKITAGVDWAKFKKIYVDVGKKNWETAPFIVSELRARGYTVNSGAAGAMPADTDCLVKLDEFWFWDLGTYLVKLEVEFINPQTKTVYASAKVRRVDVQGRRGPKIMATEALNAIFNNGMPKGVEGIL